ncbi:MAG: transcriptional regulator NrdR [Actinobacteria bacterium]|nr:transcriptional regulator NrdR [Actinomycetota bacterium]
MRCPYCRSAEDKVVDSRLAEDGAAIRRRRECASCGRRFTTFERAEAVGLRVVKRSGEAMPYSRAKVISGIAKAVTNRPVSAEDIERMADEIEQGLRQAGSEVKTSDVGLAVLEKLREVDEVGYVRFASVYKEFQELTDFEREVGLLLQKKTPPKAATAKTGDE